MDKSPETTPEQVADTCRNLGARLETESALQPYREALQRFPRKDPRAVILSAYLSCFEEIFSGELTPEMTQKKAAELNALGDMVEREKILERAGGVPGSPKKDPEDSLGKTVNESRFDYPATKRIMAIAKKIEAKSKKGRPHASTAMDALVMRYEGKSIREITDALSNLPPHEHSTPCSDCDRIGAQIDRIDKKMKKYCR